MIKYAALAIFVLRLAYQPADVHAQDATNFKTLSSTEISAPLISNVKAQVSAGRITIDWDVTDNSNTGMFEVEKSLDGREYTLTALVFASEEKENVHYTFFERVVKQTVHYRIKMITRDNVIVYATPVKVVPVKKQ